LDVYGNLYIADVLNNRVRKVNTVGIISTFAGTGTAAYSGDGGQATAAELNTPDWIIFDASGNLYISDAQNNRVRKVNTSGIISTIIGNGTGAYSGDGGQATLAEINLPSGLVFDATGNLYVSDYWNNRIRKVNTSGIISTIAGNGFGAPGSGGYSGDGGQATAAELYYPSGLGVDAANNLYIADQYNSTIRKVISGQTAGIQQFATSNEQVTIYPNPSNDAFVIETNSTTKQTVQICDINGKIVLSQIINSKINVDASSLNEGIYNISIISNEGVVNKRIIIAH